MENKNTILALVLMLAVWLGFTFLFPAQAPPPATETTQQQVAVAPEEVSPVREQVTQAPRVAQPVAAEDLRELVIETDLYTATLTNSGARLKSFELKNFKESTKKGSSNIRLTDSENERLATLRSSGTDGLAIDPQQLFSVSLPAETIAISGDQTQEIIFSTATAEGLLVEKIFTFKGNKYDFDLRLRVTNTSNSSARGNLELTLVQPWKESFEEDSFSFHGPATLVGEKLNTDDVEDLVKEGPKTYGKEARWSAFETKYFISALVPLNDAAEKIQISKTGDVIENLVQSPYLTLQPGATHTSDFLVFFGPRDLDILKEVNYELAKAIDFGFFTVVATPLLHALKFFYGYIGNYGVAIILITVILKLLFWPLTQKSYSSMKAMQKLQPQMAKVREKYKNDKQRLNMELMQLYKENRVNPLGGCLPMVIQIPVFFALYKVLMDTIELRHAPFALWITDLSAKDPYYITPLIMGATMFIQQKMTPTTMDPAQAKMFMLMPVIFTFLFLNFPSGLVIYWLINNLLTILQQYLIKRQA